MKEQVQEHLHFAGALFINILLVGAMVNYAWLDEADKPLLLFAICYPILTIMNLLVWILMRKRHDPRYAIYKWMTIALILGAASATFLVGIQ